MLASGNPLFRPRQVAALLVEYRWRWLLPLFAATIAEAPAAAQDALRDALAGIDPDALAPREALDALYRLKQILADEK